MSQRGMNRTATIVAIVLGVIGLVTVAFFITMAILFQSWGSNK